MNESEIKRKLVEFNLEIEDLWRSLWLFWKGKTNKSFRARDE